MNNNQLPFTSVEIVAVEELNLDEERDRLNLKHKVEQAFYKAGKALQKLKNRRLYRFINCVIELPCQSCNNWFGCTIIFKESSKQRLQEKAIHT